MTDNKLVVKEDENTENTIYRGDIYYADLGDDAGDNQSWICPVVVVQTDAANRHLSRTIVVPITDLCGNIATPTHVNIRSKDSKLPKDSIIVCEEIRVIDTTRIKEQISSLNEAYLSKLNMALAATLGLDLIVFPR